MVASNVVDSIEAHSNFKWGWTVREFESPPPRIHCRPRSSLRLAHYKTSDEIEAKKIGSSAAVALDTLDSCGAAH